MDKKNKNNLRNSEIKTTTDHSFKTQTHSIFEDDQIKSPLTASDLNLRLLSGNDDDYAIFKQIITDKDVVFNSWFIASRFDMSALKNYCDSFELKINLTLSDDPDVKLPEEIISQIAKKSSTQLAIDRFFNLEGRDKILKELYKIITRNSDKTGLGYFIFEDTAKNLLGGGALVIIDEEEKVKKFDLALHTLEQHRGIGNLCLQKLFKIAFEEKNADEIWVRPARESIKIASFMSKHGMIIKEDKKSGEEFYFINKDIYESLNK